MGKIKLTKGELKRQRDALGQYERYLPTLQLKKQQLQLEIAHQVSNLAAKRLQEQGAKKSMEPWVGLLAADPDVDIRAWIKPKKIQVNTENIAGVDLDVFDHIEFEVPEYDLFTTALWVDRAIERFRELLALEEESRILERGIEILRQELRITTQRVNLFEKVKIPEAKEAIRLIKIYIGDQMINAVARCKIAKRKIEALSEGVAV